MNEYEVLCSLTLDEMAIEPCTAQYDSASDEVLGRIDIPGHEGKATHALVFMLPGITTRWKQTVAYYMTGII